MYTIEKTITVAFEILVCDCCQIKFGAPSGFDAARRKDHKTFYCPNGCERYYPQDNVEEALRKKLHAATLEKERAERLTREAWAAEQRATDEAKRLQARAKAGVCPCCNRTFKQLAAHMKNKHPDAKA